MVWWSECTVCGRLPPVNGAPVFDRITSKAVAQKLGCMTSINIWQDTVVYDELTINECQKQDQAFSSMLNEVRRGFPSKATIEALQDSHNQKGCRQV